MNRTKTGQAGRTACMRGAAAAIIIAVIAAAVPGCAAQQRQKELLRISRAGLTVVVDSSLPQPHGTGTTVVSIPVNGNIAVEASKAAQRALADRGYMVEGPVLVSVGASFDAGMPVRVVIPSGELASPGDISKPFIVWPEADAAQKRKINELFVRTRSVERGGKLGPSDLSGAEGLLLVSCTTTSAGEAVQVRFVALDRASGTILWDGGTITPDVTPEGIAATVRTLLVQLPAEQRRSRN